jgi:hypothetical protein
MATASSVAQLWLATFAERTITVHDFFLLMANLRGPELSAPLKAALPGWPQPLQKAIMQLFQNRSS